MWTRSITSEKKDKISKTNTYIENIDYPYIAFQADADSPIEHLMDYACLGNSFTIEADSEPFQNAYTSYDTYNNDTKQYYVLQSYLDLSKLIDNEVTITIKAGEYSYTNTVCIPSNVTIILSEGATIKHNSKGSATTLFIFTESINEFNEISKVYPYDGVKNSKLIGSGTIDLEGQEVYSVTLPKCSDVTINGITFTGAASNNYYIRDWSSKNVAISECIFEGNNKKDNYGISISNYYSDAPCKNITVIGCIFNSMKCGIYSTNNSVNQNYHTGVTIIGNNFINIETYAIYGIGWDSSEIQNNTFKGLTSGGYAIRLYGIINPDVIGNTFTDIDYCIQISYKSPFDYNNISNAYKTSITNENNFGNFVTAIIYRQDANTSAEIWKVNHLDNGEGHTIQENSMSVEDFNYNSVI